MSDISSADHVSIFMIRIFQNSTDNNVNSYIEDCKSISKMISEIPTSNNEIGKLGKSVKSKIIELITITINEVGEYYKEDASPSFIDCLWSDIKASLQKNFTEEELDEIACYLKKPVVKKMIKELDNFEDIFQAYKKNIMEELKHKANEVYNEMPLSEEVKEEVEKFINLVFNKINCSDFGVDSEFDDTYEDDYENENEDEDEDDSSSQIW